jgi:ABC-type transport system substrate-binding protein
MKRLAMLLVVATVLASLVAACGPTPTPQVIKETVVVEKEVEKKVEVEVTKVVEVQVEVTAEPVVEKTGPSHGGTLTMVLREEPLGLDNFADPGTQGQFVIKQMVEGLVNADMDQNIAPRLAESWEMSDDGTVYTFHLRKGVKFHDGTEFDAEDVKWTFDEAIIPDTYMGRKWAPYVESTEIVDKYTVKVNLIAPWFDFMTYIAYEDDLAIRSRDAVEEWGDEYGYKAVVGTGPFKFDHWVRGEELVLIRNDEWWGAGEEGLPYLDKIMYRTIPEEATKMVQLVTGNVDVVSQVPFENAAAYRSDPNLVVESTPAGTQHYLYLSPWFPPFDDIELRQAMNYAIDKQAIVDSVFAGEAAVSNGIFPPTVFVHENDRIIYPYDPEKAKQMLAEAGYDEANPLKFLLLTSSASPYVDEAILVQAQLAEIGVQAEVLPMENVALVTYIMQQAPDWEQKRQALLFRRGLSGLVINDYTYRGFFSTGAANRNGYNQEGGIQNPEVEQLILDTYQLTDKDKLQENCHKLNEMIMMDAPAVFIAYENNIIANQKYVKGFRGNWPLPFMTMEGVWLEK